MLLCWTDDAWADYLYWQSQDRRTLKRVNTLIRDMQRTPFEGIGKPEPLKWGLSGAWSRRIDSANRIIYTVADDRLCILSAKDHSWMTWGGTACTTLSTFSVDSAFSDRIRWQFLSRFQ